MRDRSGPGDMTFRIVILLALLIAPAAAAAAPVPIAPRAADVSPVDLLFDGEGRALASWRGLRGDDADALAPFIAMAIRDGGWRPARELAATVMTARFATFGRARMAVVAWRELRLPGRRTRSAITLGIGDTRTGEFRRRIRLAAGPPRRASHEGPQPTLSLPAIGAARDGRLVIAWHRAGSGVWAATRRPDGRVTAPRRIGPGGGEPFVRVAPGGSALVVWRRGRRLQARLRGTGGGWGAVQTIATAERGAALEHVALDGDGVRFAVGVVQTRRSLEGVRIRLAVHALSPGGGWRGAPLARFTYVPSGSTSYVTDHLRVLPVVTSDGRLRVLWAAPSADGRVNVRAGEVAGTASGIAVRDVHELTAGADVALEHAAAGPDGRFAFTWFDGTVNAAEVPGRVRAALATERSLLGARVAYDPVSGRPLVVWAQGDSGYQPVATSL